MVIVVLLATFASRQEVSRVPAITVSNVSATTGPAEPETASPHASSGGGSIRAEMIHSQNATEATPGSDASHVIREEKREIKPALRELARDFQRQPFSEMDFPLFDGAFVHLTALRHTRIDEQAGVFTGRVGGDPLSHVVLSYVGRAESGSIHHPSAGTYFEVRNADNGNSSYLTRVDPSKFPPCATCATGAVPPRS